MRPADRASEVVTTKRTDLLVPPLLIATLRVPLLAVTSGAADVDWADLPERSWRPGRRPTHRLPLDPRSARRARRYLRLMPWLALASLALLLSAVATFRIDLPALSWPLIFLASLILTVFGGALPRQTPTRTRTGELRIPAVPIEVAKKWVEANPGVRPTIEPPPRRFSRRVYAAWSAGLGCSRPATSR